MPEQFKIPKSVLVGLGGFLRPLARFLLRSGIGFQEFSDICKAAFVSVAYEEDTGRIERTVPASRISEITGINRKEVGRLRKKNLVQLETEYWSADLNPLTQVLHFWHSDPDFSESGKPMLLEVRNGAFSFDALVRRYVTSLTPDVMRAELVRSGAVKELPNGQLVALSRQYTPTDVDTEFVRTMVFSLRNLTSTLVHNAKVIAEEGPGSKRGNLERYVWTTRIPRDQVREFKAFAEGNAERLLAELDTWIGEEEMRFRRENKDGKLTESDVTGVKNCGFGVYYFESDD